ncbi:cyclase family protein [Planosporangium flavigriseum]|uniref:Cyclase n=1 Tax=Planosporangium flavigriseum TaxID=373681 RepID=A0A8J3LY94_9ACTN|nr:cyclase family protein [Planosporangium flavigriseum]NJC67470.1 cyclase family protein [Planosporangium flavigriseum]GIG75580.1 cyclase [Planosporangium flavigriseum]
MSTLSAETSESFDRREFDRLFEEVKNWGRWGSEDARGALNHLTPARVAAAAAGVREGRTVSLAHDLDTVAGPDNHKPALHYMSQCSDIDDIEPRVNMDFLGMDFHGKSITHLDALCHCNYQGKLFNGVSSAEAVTSGGSAFGSVMSASSGIIGRGVLLDVPRSRGVEWLDPGTAVHPEELQRVAAEEGVQLSQGDIVLVRTGARRRRAALGPWDPSNFSAGLFPTVMRWLHQHEIAVLGGDADSDARPSPVDGVTSPIHALALTAMGLHLVDNVNLEPLAATCAELNRWEFLCVLAPLRVPGGTGSPLNPIAIF